MFLYSRLKCQRERSVHQKQLLSLRNRLVLGAFALFTAICLFWGHSIITGLLPVGFAAPAQASSDGRGAGGIGIDAQAPTLCNPLDTACVIGEDASWVAGRVQSAFQPIIDSILGNPADIIYQTPPEDSYQNSTILTINTLLIGVVDTALASLLVIGAYNVMVGHHLNLLHSSVSELLPRVILMVGAVHFNVFFLRLFIDFENALAQAVIQSAGIGMLTNFIKGLFDNPLTGLITFVLIVVLGIMVLLLLIQMVTRIALVAVSLAIAPLGLACLMLGQTMRWGRLWLTILSSSVLVQVLQVVALSLGGTFISAIASTSLIHLDKELATLFLSIGMMLLVLKIPGMLQTWALHPMLEGGNRENNNSEQTTTSSRGGNGGGGGEAGSGGTGGSQVVEGTVVTEESGTLVILF